MNGLKTLPGDYAKTLDSLGVDVVHRSQWLNGVSILASTSQINALRALPIVRQVTPVRRWKHDALNVQSKRHARFRSASQKLSQGSAPASTTSPMILTVLDYGPSLAQNNQLGIVDLHEMGYSGNGVVVAILDSGFDTHHPATKDLNVVGQHDFVDNDDSVDLDPGDDPTSPLHGTSTWSVLGGFSPGKLIGPAHGASFLLARTEDVRAEYPVEEDNFVAALEWAAERGAKVVSASLAYLEFDGDVGYGFSDLNGINIPLSAAVRVAAKNGILIVSPSGNSGPSATSIWAPADADSIFTVGAVDSFGVIAPFSSRGPTADGRLKPELVALGVDAYAAWLSGTFVHLSGTSLSTPLVAGGLALLLEAHPDWTPPEVRRMLFASASQANSPDNSYGYGIPNFRVAAESMPMSSPRLSSPFRILGSLHNSDRSITFHWSRSLPNRGSVKYELVAGLGADPSELATLWQGSDTTTTIPFSNLEGPPAFQLNHLLWSVYAHSEAGTRIAYGQPLQTENIFASLSPAPSPETFGWSNEFGRLEVNGPVHKLFQNSPNTLVVAGEFTSVAGSASSGVSEWDGSQWRVLGSQPLGVVTSISQFQNQIIAAGEFSKSLLGSNVAQWNGTNWEPLGSLSLPPKALLSWNGLLLASTDYLSFWDGTEWQHFGQPPSTGAIISLVNYNNDLVAASRSGVFKWNGSSWNSLLSLTSPDDEIANLAVVGDTLLVAGHFTYPSNNLALWDGAQWKELGGGTNGAVTALSAVGNSIWITGTFSRAGSRMAPGVAFWMDSQWNAPNSGPDGPVYTISGLGEDVYLGGDFQTAGTVANHYLSIWSDEDWHRLGQGMDAPVSVLLSSGDSLIAGGSFRTAGGKAVSYLAVWDGRFWKDLAQGVNDRVWTLSSDTENIYAGGAFTSAGGIKCSRIARWDGRFWHPLGQGMDFPVFTLAWYKGDLYAGGAFSTADGNPVGFIARWTGSTWTSVGQGLNGWVTSLAVFQNHLIATGFFSTADGQPASRIAQWDGNVWSPIGSTFRNFESVTQLAVYKDDLILAGRFTISGSPGAHNIISWDGVHWSSLDAGVNNQVTALASDGNNLYVGGEFVSSGFLDIGRLAVWNGQWRLLDSRGPGGAPGSLVTALTTHKGSVWAGGDFISAGGYPSHYIARWDGTSSIVSFTAEPIYRDRKAVVVSWTVLGDSLASTFSVARTDSLGDTLFVAGPSTGEHKYLFRDEAAPLTSVNYWIIETTKDKNEYWHGPLVAPPYVFPLALLQNYPNPVTRGTTFSFELTKAGRVAIRVYDIQGRQVSTVLDNVVTTGLHTIPWNPVNSAGERLPPGVYIYRLQTESGERSRKMIVIR